MIRPEVRGRPCLSLLRCPSSYSWGFSILLATSFVALLLGLTQARGAFVITEVMTDSSHPGGNANGDWWELTNVGFEDVDLGGYSWDDSDRIPGTSVFPGVTVAAGQSIVIVDEGRRNLQGFMQAWGIWDEDAIVLSRDQFGGNVRFSGLSASSDEVNLYSNHFALVASVSFGNSDGGGRTFSWDRSQLPLGLSIAGLDGAYVALGNGAAGIGTDVGSPCVISVLSGDVNLDGGVNGQDVDPFVDVLLNGPYQTEADMNGDQVVNGLDVDPFVAAVVGGTQPVPEPSALLLCIIALGVVGGCRKRAA